MRNNLNKGDFKEQIKVTYDCIPCAIGSLITLFKKGFVPTEKQEPAMRALLNYLSQIDYNQTPPAMGQEMHRIIRKILENSDPYAEIKEQFNRLMLNYYPDLKKQVEQAPDPFQQALRLAIAGNIIDFGPNQHFDIHGILDQSNSIVFAIDDSLELKEAISQAETLLYLGDNAGEIVMDRIFLETIQHPNVYFAVRGAPIINDAIEKDAKMVGIDHIAKLISNGDDAPGTIPANTSPEFQRIFNQADLIISKGQGNYESLSGYDRNIYFLLMAKCNIIADHLGVKKGDLVVKKERKNKSYASSTI